MTQRPIMQHNGDYYYYDPETAELYEIPEEDKKDIYVLESKADEGHNG